MLAHHLLMLFVHSTRVHTALVSYYGWLMPWLGTREITALIESWIGGIPHAMNTCIHHLPHAGVISNRCP